MAVVGLAAGRMYGMQSRRFVQSLRKTGYDGKIILGVDASTERTLRSFYSAQKVTAIVVTDVHK